MRVVDLRKILYNRRGFLPTFARKKWALTTFIWAFDGFARFEKWSKPKKSGLLPTFGN